MYSLVCNQEGINVVIASCHIFNPLAKFGTTLAFGSRSHVERWHAAFTRAGVQCYVCEHR